MPSQQVIEKLDQLRAELDKLQSAAEIIQQASGVTQNANQILEAFPDFLKQLNDHQTNHLNTLLASHTKNIQEIESLINETFFTALPEFLKQVKHELNESFVKNISESSIQLSEIVNSFDFSSQNIQSKIYSAIADLEANNQNIASSANQLSTLADAFNKFINVINQINFPARLEKLDATTAGIMAAVQSVQSRIDLSERNTSDQLKNLIDHQKTMELNAKDKIDTLQSKLENILILHQSKLSRQNFITWLLVIGTLASLGYSIFFK